MLVASSPIIFWCELWSKVLLNISFTFTWYFCMCLYAVGRRSELPAGPKSASQGHKGWKYHHKLQLSYPADRLWLSCPAGTRKTFLRLLWHSGVLLTRGASGKPVRTETSHSHTLPSLRWYHYDPPKVNIKSKLILFTCLFIKASLY